MEKQKGSKKAVNNVGDKKVKKMEGKNSSSVEVSMVMKIVIGILMVIILALLGYLMFQVGKGSTDLKRGSDKTVVDSNDPTLGEKGTAVGTTANDVQTQTNASPNENPNADIISSNSVSGEDLDRVIDEINEVSTDYDDLETVGSDLQEWPN